MCTERKATGEYVLACFRFATMGTMFQSDSKIHIVKYYASLLAQVQMSNYFLFVLLVSTSRVKDFNSLTFTLIFN